MAGTYLRYLKCWNLHDLVFYIWNYVMFFICMCGVFFCLCCSPVLHHVYFCIKMWHEGKKWVKQHFCCTIADVNCSESVFCASLFHNAKALIRLELQIVIVKVFRKQICRFLVFIWRCFFWESLVFWW